MYFSLPATAEESTESVRVVSKVGVTGSQMRPCAPSDLETMQTLQQQAPNPHLVFPC